MMKAQLETPTVKTEVAAEIKKQKLLQVAVKNVELKAIMLETQAEIELHGGKIGDYIVILPAGNCIRFAKSVFETMFQTRKYSCGC